MKIHRIGILAAAIAGLGVASIASATTLNGISNLSGLGGNYTDASSIPVSSTDLIEGLLPIHSNYSGCCEDGGSTDTSPFTDGKTAVNPLNLSETTGPGNSLFELPSGFTITYRLPNLTALTSIVVTTGHQDGRVNQNYDILVSSNDVTYASLSGGVGFHFNPSDGSGGAAQSTLTNFGALGVNVRFVQFTALDSGNDVFRELDVNGVPEPASLCLLSLGGLALLRRRSR